jgi:hypothetical protein
MFERIYSAIVTFVKGPLSDEAVARVMDEAVAKKGEKLDWRHSVVDFMKALDLDSDEDAREELADDLGIRDYSGTAEQNIALHAALMKQVRGRYVDVPKAGED